VRLTILAQQQVATFPVPDGEICLWQPEGVSFLESEDQFLSSRILSETVPWTEEMVHELWTGMLQEDSDETDLLASEVQDWIDLDELVEGQSVDICAPSYFIEWDQSTGCSSIIKDGKGRVKKFTPEIMDQRDLLNWHFNFRWNIPPLPGTPYTRFAEVMGVPDQVEFLEIVSVGENYSIAKSDYGSVYIPKGIMNYLDRNGGCEVGATFDGEMTFTPNNKCPWRLNRDGVKYTYQELRNEDY